MKTNLILFVIIAGLTYSATLYFESRKPATKDITIAPQSPIGAATIAPLPDFTFTDKDGKTLAAKDFKGRPIILNFWASWCPPCIKEIPLLIKAAKEQNIALIALSSDIDEAAMNAFLKKQNLSAPPENVIFAWDENTNITQKIFQTFKLPETILIDSQGLMRSKIIGADWEYDDLVKQIDSIKAAAD